jgi:hypothetical protein
MERVKEERRKERRANWGDQQRLSDRERAGVSDHNRERCDTEMLKHSNISHIVIVRRVRFNKVPSLARAT